ncbi:uncharacterized protein LOC131659888 [Vicia villosa]|uniref:uncharacterized protein LOC131659888 n=1 Tax=Vicia villosa TaxID=3911 RepID=UPI00273AF306|nr:uncharacterized protein LOC131659888 [Vicia villosa]
MVLVEMLLDHVQKFCKVNHGRDDCFWAMDEEAGFSVKACAEEFRKRGTVVGLQSDVLSKLGFMWKLKVPSKVSIFAWRYILGRLPTRDQLNNRRILVGDRDCCYAFYFNAMENSNHLFVSCPFTSRILIKVGDWLGNLVTLTNVELRSYVDHFDKIKAIDERLTVEVIWLAVLWNLWMMRNAILFNSYIFNFDECYSAIVLVSWKWFRLVNVSSTAYNFHFLNTLPLSCIKR